MKAAWALAMKDLKLLLRDRAAAFFVFIFPLFVAVLFGWMFSGSGGSGKMDVSLVDEDGGPAAKAFATDLAADGALTIRPAASRTEGESLVRAGKVDACIVIPKGFDPEGIFSGQGMKVEGIVDPAHKVEAGLLTGKLNEVGFKQLASAFSSSKALRGMTQRGRDSVLASSGLDAAWKKSILDLLDKVDPLATRIDEDDKKVAESATPPADPFAASTPEPAPIPVKKAESPLASWRPVNVEVHELAAATGKPRTSYEISFPQGVVWGLMGCVTGFGASLAFERARGTLMRLSAAPMTRGQILLGKALACLIACVSVQVLLLIVGVLAFNLHVDNWPLMAGTVLLASLAFVGLMMVLAGMSSSEAAAAGAGRAVLIVLAIIGGGSIPLAFMPDLMRKLTVISPFRWVVDSIAGALYRDFTLSQMLVPWGVLAAFGAAGYIIGISAFKWSKAT